MASELLQEISQDEHERALFRSRRKFETDAISDRLTSEKIGRMRVASNLLTQGKMSVEEIAAAANLTIDDVLKLK